jgi:copper chaperone NosL
MTRVSTIIVWIAVVLFLGAYVFPLWSISLSAPQYPEGMGMNIWVAKITGRNQHDLQNINQLNHYIGMKEIHAESIPELVYMKYIVGGLMLLGVLAGVTRKRRMLVLWVVASATVAVVGLVDFYRWAYDYGHNLDPDAPIKVPGMTYQPPLFGSKQLLNITATSYPAMGGLLLMLGVALGMAVLVWEWRRGRTLRTNESKVRAGSNRVAMTVAMILLLAACAIKPSPIEFGVDTCDYCRMTISDERYGSEIVTKKGRVYKYDAVECMAAAVLAGDIDNASVSMYLTIDHASPQELVDATSAVYLHSPTLRSPMGMNLTSFATREGANHTAERFPGDLLTWAQAKGLVDEARQRAKKLQP